MFIVSFSFSYCAEEQAKLKAFTMENDLLNGKLINFGKLNYHPLINMLDAIKPAVDKKRYYSYIHRSGLPVLIIQDINAKQTGVAMSINSGVNKEGSDIYGLAHFCEHLLFLGSKKYPKPTFFIDYLTKYGGKFNGFTDFETTGFYYKINSANFPVSLDIFAQIFINPLFSKQYVSKEINSVNSEFERNLQLDKKRKERILRATSDKDSLFHRFSTGNTQTLRDYSKEKKINLGERVFEYFKSQFLPHNMKLVIMGKHSVNIYRTLVDTYFAEMEASALVPPKSQWTKLPFQFNQIGKLVLYQTINKHQQLDIIFLTDDIFQNIPDNPALYYKILINYQGQGGLNDILRKRGYVAGIKSSFRRTYAGFAFFKLQGYVTLKGIQELNQMLKVIFQFLKSIAQKATDNNLYNNVKRTLDKEFFFKRGPKKKILGHMKSWCIKIWKYPMKYFWSAHKLLSSYNKQSIVKFGEFLTLKNAVIMIGNNHFDHHLNLNLTQNYSNFVENFTNHTHLTNQDQFYKTDYSSFQFKEEFLQSMDSLPSQKFPKNTFHLFTHKKRKSQQVSLLKQCSPEKRSECMRSFRMDETDCTPHLLKSNDHLKLWYKQDRSFLQAKTNCFLRYIFNKDVNDPLYATYIKLIIFALHHHLKTFFYEESLRKTSFKLSANPNGFSVHIYSYADTLHETTSMLINRMKQLNLTEPEFDLIKDEMKTNIHSQMNQVPSSRAYATFLKIILKDNVDNQTFLENLKNVTLQEFNTTYNELFSNYFVKAFIHGAMEKSQAEEMYNEISKLMTPTHPEKIDDMLINYTNLHANLSGYYIFREHYDNKHNLNHAVVNFYQIGLETIDNLIKANIIKTLGGYIYFTELRIKEQLGYTAKAKLFSEGGVLYYMIFVQGSRKTPEYIDLRIENLLGTMRQKIAETDIKHFETTKKLVSRRIGKKDKTLKDRTKRIWNEIMNDRGYFNITALTKEHAKNITKKDILEFFDKMITTNLSKLSVQEFSMTANIPKELPVVRKYQSVLIEEYNSLKYFNNKFIKRNWQY